jgi:hypothetical protein
VTSRLARSVAIIASTLVVGPAAVLSAPATASAATLVHHYSWAGYVIHAPARGGTTVTADTVSATWHVPKLDCSNNGQAVTSDAAIIVGLGAKASGSLLAQTGIRADCRHKDPVYKVFYRVRADPVDETVTQPAKRLGPGDRLSATVKYLDGEHGFDFTLQNHDADWTFHDVVQLSQAVPAVLNTAEAVLESPAAPDPAHPSGPLVQLPLTKLADALQFDDFEVNHIDANHDTYRDLTVRAVLMADYPRSTTLAVPTLFKDSDSFAVDWRHRGQKRPAH